MNKAGDHAQESSDQRVHYILLAIEAEVLSEQAVSPYLREAYLRLSRFWLTCAAMAQGDGGKSEKFHAPTRAQKCGETYKVEPLCPLDDAGEDIGGERAGLLVDV